MRRTWALSGVPDNAHAPRKFVEASRAVQTTGDQKKAGQPAKADVALSKIRKLYAIQKSITDMDFDKKKQARQSLSVPVLDDLKQWLEKNVSRVPKDSLTHKGMIYTQKKWVLRVSKIYEVNLPHSGHIT